VNAFTAALGADLTAIGVGSVTVARTWPARSGRHRAPRRRAEVLVPLADLLGDEPEGLVHEQCPREQIQRPHLAFPNGARTCTTCGHATTGGTP
jgi:hypothetical protein